MPTSKEIGNIFKEARKKKKLNLLDAAHKSRILEEVVRDIESGVFDRLGKPYLKGFLGKYADFLGLDADQIIDQYEAISGKIPSKELDFGQDPKENKVDVLPGYRKRRTHIILITSVSVVLLILIFILVGTVRSRSYDRGPQERTVSSKRSTPKRTVIVSKPSNTSSLYKLTLKATGEVWVQVKQGDVTLYAGIMQNGDTKTFADDGPLTVLTGKGDFLEFIFNGKNIGAIVAGVAKDIRVSSDGIKVGTRWAARRE